MLDNDNDLVSPLQLERTFRAEAEADHLRRQIAELQAKHQEEAEPTPDSIPRPHQLKSFAFKELRTMLGLDGDAQKMEWNQIRVRLRLFLRCELTF